MRRNILRIVLVTSVMLLLVGIGSWLLPSSSAPATKPLPNPNGYDVFIKASHLIADDPGSVRTNRDELRQSVETNAGALRLARTGFELKCQVPVEYSQAYADRLTTELSGLKKLGLAFAAEGRLAELGEHPAEAAKSYLDAVRLGVEAPRGGLVPHAITGNTIEAAGTKGLGGLASRLELKTCRETVAVLESLDASRQTWMEVWGQETEWSRRVFTGLRYRILSLFTTRARQATAQAYEQRCNARVAQTRQILIDLAARAYELEKKQKPQSLADLVPAYLKAIPLDPTTGTNMVYLP